MLRPLLPPDEPLLRVPLDDEPPPDDRDRPPEVPPLDDDRDPPLALAPPDAPPLRPPDADDDRPPDGPDFADVEDFADVDDLLVPPLRDEPPERPRPPLPSSASGLTLLTASPTASTAFETVFLMFFGTSISRPSPPPPFAGAAHSMAVKRVRAARIGPDAAGRSATPGP